MFISFGSADIAEELKAIRQTQQATAVVLDQILNIVRTIMADVKIAQEDLDATADALLTLVAELNALDLTPLPAADQSRLVNAVTSVTDAVNRVTGPKTPDVPAPNPEPEPTPAPEPVPVEETPSE